MEELIITANSYTPARVDFNYQKIADQLDVILDKYKGLIFTEETVLECNKTIAELRKGQKSLENFRKETKKKLTKSVTEFENDCKVLYNKFDEVILPLTDQASFFEEQRREEKKKEIEVLIDELAAEFKLEPEYSANLVVEETYLIKSISMKKIKEDLTEKAKNLKNTQVQNIKNRELITNIANSEQEISLDPEVYIRLLEYEDITSIITKMYADRDRILKEKEKEIQRMEEQARIEAELELAKQSRMEEVAEVVEKKLVNIIDVSDNDLEKAPLKDEIITKEYRVSATRRDLERLEEMLNEENFMWDSITLEPWE